MVYFSIKNIYTSINWKYNVDAKVDAFDNVISGNEPSSEMLTNEGQNWNEPKLVVLMPKRH